MKRAGSGKARCKTTPTSVGPPKVVHVPLPDHLEDQTIVATLNASHQIASVREGSLGLDAHVSQTEKV